MLLEVMYLQLIHTEMLVSLFLTVILIEMALYFLVIESGNSSRYAKPTLPYKGLRDLLCEQFQTVHALAPT